MRSVKLSSDYPPALVEDVLIETPHGRMFARVWGGRDDLPNRTTIILLHDSLGCVELWRDFPAKLAQASGLPVVGYDRLGFGRSDPHPGILSFDFVREEAHGGLTAL